MTCVLVGALRCSGCLFLDFCTRIKTDDKKYLQSGLLVLVSPSILLREIEDYNLPAMIIWLGHGTGRTITLITLWLAALYHARPLFKSFWSTLKKAFSYPSGWMYLFGVVFLFAGMFFDKKWLSPPAGLPMAWVEEMLEVNGYMLMCVSALFFLMEQKLKNQLPKAEKVSLARTIS